MATNMGKLQKKEYHQETFSQGSMIVSCEITFFVNVCSNMIEKRFFAEQDFTYRMSEPEYFHYTQNWWISLSKSGDTGGPLRNRFGFYQALSAQNRLHRESGGQQLRPMPYWKYQQRHGVVLKEDACKGSR